MNSKRKGKTGELELARILRDEYGYKVKRTVQYCGANKDADLEGLPGLHIEVKRREALNIHEAVDQAKRESRKTELPTVWHRKNGTEWLVTMPLKDFMTMYGVFVGGDPKTFLQGE